MRKRRMAWIALFSLLAMVLVMIPAARVKADTPPIVDGLFYGNPDGITPDKDTYTLLAENPGRGDLYYYVETKPDPGPDILYLAVVVDPSVNDNVFGNKKYTNGDLFDDDPYLTDAGWLGGVTSAGHSFDNLFTSDMVAMVFQCGGNSWTWQQGYIYGSQDTGWLSGPADPSGGLAVTPANPDLLLQTASSLMYNMNYNGWDVTMNDTRSYKYWKSVDTTYPDPPSPDPGDNILNELNNEEGWGWTPNFPPYNGDGFNDAHYWEWAMVYEMSINLGVCDGQRWTVGVISAHNSPSKDGNTEVPIEVYDFGDLPDSYDTTLAGNGPRHQLLYGGPGVGFVPILGFTVDSEADGQPTDGANGDDYNTFYGIPFLDPGWEDDEDGVLTTGDNPVPGTNFTLEISGTQGAILDAWFDWNYDGVLDSSEHYTKILTGDWTDYDFGVPSGIAYPETLYARFRVTTDGIDTPYGAAPDGEVEDYVWPFSPTSVGLVSFTATADNHTVLVQWETATEVDTLGYNLERAGSPDGPWTQLNGDLIYDEEALGRSWGAHYDYPDTSVEEGLTYYYRLVSLDVFGGSSYHGPISVTVPAIDGAVAPRSPAGLHRLYLPFVVR
jgi:hypothetical protein